MILNNARLEKLQQDWRCTQGYRTTVDNTKAALKWFLIGRNVEPTIAHVLAYNLDIFSMELL